MKTALILDGNGAEKLKGRIALIDDNRTQHKGSNRILYGTFSGYSFFEDQLHFHSNEVKNRSEALRIYGDQIL